VIILKCQLYKAELELSAFDFVLRPATTTLNGNIHKVLTNDEI
jgi:hypothetical protein